MTDVPFLGIEHRPFNFRLREAREGRGWTRARLAREAGVSQGLVGDCERLKRWPSPRTATKIAVALDDLPETLFPAEAEIALRGRSARSAVSVLPIECLSLDSPEGQALLQASTMAPDPLMEEARREALEGVMAGLLGSLPYRERRVLQLRFGLADVDAPMVLREAGKELGTSPERIHQIEARALRMLRNPVRSRQLLRFMS